MTPSTKFEIWLEKVNAERKVFWDSRYTYKEYEPLTYTKGKKYIKIMAENSVWGFVAMVDGLNKGAYHKVGDLLKPANYSSPAKHSRGNIFDGTATYTFWGPQYLK